MYKKIFGFQHTYEGLKLLIGYQMHYIALRVFSIPMRDWNRITIPALWPSLLFSAYLWGIETYTISHHSDWWEGQFSAYLWGIETLPLVEALPCPLKSFQHTYEGLKLTTRDNLTIKLRRFQHTYEGLKLMPSMICGEAPVPFSAYLWGIETRELMMKMTFPTYGVFSIPMRDWNFTTAYHGAKCAPGFQHTYEGLKPDLQNYREQLTVCFQHTYEGLKRRETEFVTTRSVRFQHTYEGLKLGLRMEESVSRRGFQHTYEGLKLMQADIANLEFKRFQHTYEGLKQSSSCFCWLSFKSFQHTYEGLKHRLCFHRSSIIFVFSIPMRDWN